MNVVSLRGWGTERQRREVAEAMPWLGLSSFPVGEQRRNLLKSAAPVVRCGCIDGDFVVGSIKSIST